MRASDVPTPREVRLADLVGSGRDVPYHAVRLCAPLSVEPGSALRQGDARLEGVVPAGWVEDTASRALPCGRQRASGAWGADGGVVGALGGEPGDGGPSFDQAVVAGGYAWWYLDAISDDQKHGLTIIAFVGSVFSPYYAWKGRADPLDHCAVNVALYGPRSSRWAMTERDRAAVTRDRDWLVIGRSSLLWNGERLTIDIDERGSPLPLSIRGRVEVRSESINLRPFVLELQGRHLWRPIAPQARVAVDLDRPSLHWHGIGYFDHNRGDEPIERAFSDWTWSRAQTSGGSAILYEAGRRREEPLSMGLHSDRRGGVEERPLPPSAALPTTRWRLAQSTRADDGKASFVRVLEDTPFYARSTISHRLFAEQVLSVHEALSLDRFSNPAVRLMLPFRMRWRRSPRHLASPR